MQAYKEWFLTEERFLLKLPSLILSGATFLALDFLSWGFGVGLDFLRAFGPTEKKYTCQITFCCLLKRNPVSLKLHDAKQIIQENQICL